MDFSWLLGAKKQDPRSDSSYGEIAPTVSSIIGGENIDSSRLQQLSGVAPGQLEFLDLEGEELSDLPGSRTLLPSRGWSDDLCYGTGATYLLGLGIGGAYGLSEGLRTAPADASSRLRLNYVLNSVTKRGPYLGNSAGVLALTYNVINSSLDSYRGKHDDLNSLFAGALSGAIFRSTHGIRPMMISAGLMTLVSGAWCGLKRVVISD
ncbi:hypothetical protein CANCADRAFT_57054 [Tortispora caseinolytica NRRL Y-17796]|uniref:Mitochondrial import inner membrane translocase subunit TIM23 n=1 Tax=Tortispora caseinolytica NRRL Y-17796 TaxID=767744 RepID=A0A1E4TFU3_9ASCO|nr:hypothetical protein CANCADRAFT_57054 [Tortispora caseinolytica NRRL Y-17796]